MRRAARVDGNQKLVVRALRELGCSIQHLHTLGKGCPDLLIGMDGINYLLELKDSSKPPSKRQLTPDEVAWHQSWRGQVHIVNSVQDAIAILKTPIN